ncbi:MAG: C39 family peptidase [Clostridia bacterium]
MKMNNKKIIASAVTLILVIIAVFFGISYTDEDVEKISKGIETVVNIVDSVSTTEIPQLSEEDEQVLEVQESDLENDAFEQKSDIAYNGSDKTPSVELGEYQGLTYYSQADGRWANHQYSSTGNKSQTIESSGCGPTAAAMVVSSIRGTITPPEMGDLFVKYGYRSANNGTYWSAMKWTADVFNIGYKETSSLDTAVSLLKDNYYIVAICNEGLFTYRRTFHCANRNR